MEVKLDIGAMDKAFAAALPEYEKKVQAKVDNRDPARVEKVAQFASVAKVDFSALAVAEEFSFCKAWPGINATINNALGWFSWIPGTAKPIAAVKAFLVMMNAVVIPRICGPVA